MYHRVRKKMTRLIISAILLLAHPLITTPKTLETSPTLALPEDEGFDNNTIDFDELYTVKFNKQYGVLPWHANDFNKNTHKYTIIKNSDNSSDTNVSYNPNNTKINTNVRYNPYNNENALNTRDETTTEDFKVIPLELVSTTENALVSLIESTTEHDLTVIPLSTTNKLPSIDIDETITLPTTTEIDVTSDGSETTTNIVKIEETTAATDSIEELSTTLKPMHLKSNDNSSSIINKTNISNIILPKTNVVEISNLNNNSSELTTKASNNTEETVVQVDRIAKEEENVTTLTDANKINSTEFKAENRSYSVNETRDDDTDVPVFTELDTEDFENIPEDYYDNKDIIPTSTPKTDAISVLFGLAGSVVESVVESVAEKVVPKGIFDLFKRMQRQNEALEAERLRSREENGGIGQFGRGILKSLSTGLSRPLSQLMAGVKEAGSLDTDRGFVGNVASSVTSVANAANTYLEAFKDKVQAIYPGTVWCGDGHSAQARSSSELGLFFFTDTCCRQHDACKIYIKAGETKFGLTNTGLFTRSHCSCDTKFRECLRRTNSLVSAQIGLTYFNVLGPQCFRRSHPIVKCNRRTRITGQKCEEYELDYTKPRMWQWFDNETF